MNKPPFLLIKLHTPSSSEIQSIVLIEVFNYDTDRQELAEILHKRKGQIHRRFQLSNLDDCYHLVKEITNI